MMPFTPSLISSSVTQVTNAEEIYKKRIQGRQILLENPVRAKKPRKERKKKEGLSKKWVKEQGLLKLKESEQKCVCSSW
jgi:ribonuclease P protein subunit POP4